MIQGSTGEKKSELGFPPQYAFTQWAYYGVLRKDYLVVNNLSYVENIIYGYTEYLTGLAGLLCSYYSLNNCKGDFWRVTI